MHHPPSADPGALLADTDLPLATVAATVGFYDQSDLTRRFARLIGQTPAQFRLATQPNLPLSTPGSTDIGR